MSSRKRSRSPKYTHTQDIDNDDSSTSPKRLKTVDAVRWRLSLNVDKPSASGSENSHLPSSPSTSPRRADPFLKSFFPGSSCTTSGPPELSKHSATTSTSDSPNISVDDAHGVPYEDSEEDEEWEEVGVDTGSMSLDISLPSSLNSPQTTGDEEGFTITIKRPDSNETAKESVKSVKKNRGIRKEDRIRRMLAHKVHLLCLLACGLYRNRWCNDLELRAITLSILPDDIYAAIKGKKADKGKGKQKSATHKKYLIHYLQMLARWWKEQVKVKDTPSGQALQGPISLLDQFGSYLEKSHDDPSRYVSAESSALLFTAACRALNLQTRLICSLHPIPLSLSSDKKSPSRSNGTRPRRRTVRDSDEDTIDEEPLSRATEESTPLGGRRRTTTVHVPYPLRYWCEVYSEDDKQWVAVDPVRGLVNDTVVMEPPASVGNQLQISYVVAYESDFGVKDVTRRYTSQWGARTVRLRLPPGAEGEDWWQQTLWFYSKSNKGEVDEKEDEQLRKSEVKEKMPTSLAGFKDHPLYALEKHLKKYEIIHPSGKEHAIGRFKNELVYPRNLVHELHTRETWLKKGRRVLPIAEPVKYVKARVATITRKRQIEMEKMNDPRGKEDLGAEGDSSMSAVFGEWQTEEFIADPLVDGKIPKNSFGNIEIFHKNMIPAGAVHLQLPGVGRLAKKLGIDYATAVTGFEFHAGRSTPALNGIIIAEEFADVLKAAYEENLQIQQEQEIKKREKRVYGRWKKLVISLLTRDRLRREYLVDEDEEQP